MLVDKITQKKQVDDNFIAFKELMAQRTIPQKYYGYYALMKDGEIKGYFNTWEDAVNASHLIEDNIFSIQQVRNDIADIGFFSHF